jgi:hypothetical protein
VDGMCTTSQYGGMPYWDVSLITDMAYAFWGRTAFNADIRLWNTGSNIMTRAMFYNAASFDQPIGSWDTSRVYSMRDMFFNAIAFNQPIGAWDTGNVWRMQSMFSGAATFAQDITGWRPRGPSYDSMFEDATAWNLAFQRIDGSGSVDGPPLKWIINPLPPYPPPSAPSPPPSAPPPSPPTVITDANFQSAVATCLSGSPVDGMCTTSEYGAMPNWDVSRVTDNGVDI